MNQTENNRPLVDGVPALERKLEEVRRAQEQFATFSQEQVDRIFQAAALAANHARLPLAKMAVEETGMGVVEDKVIKNNYAAEYIYNAYKHTKTCGIIEQDPAYGTMRIAEPEMRSSFRPTPVQKRARSLRQRSYWTQQLRLVHRKTSSAGSMCRLWK